MGECGREHDPVSRTPLLGGDTGEVRDSFTLQEGRDRCGLQQLQPVAQVGWVWHIEGQEILCLKPLKLVEKEGKVKLKEL